MMRKQNLVALSLCLALVGCRWMEEQEKVSQRRDAETAFVGTVESGDTAAVRAALEADRTLASSLRWVRLSRRARYSQTQSALTAAVKRGRLDMVALLLASGADPNMPDGTGTLPLVAALRSVGDKAALLSALLDKGAAPLKGDAKGKTALHYAAQDSRDSDDLLKLLVAKAGETGGPDVRGLAPLHYAAEQASVPAIRVLVEKGADPNLRTTAPQPNATFVEHVAGTTPLAIVALDRQIAAAATLCSLGADPGIADSSGASARQVAERVAAKEGARSSPTNTDLVRHRNMAAFLARGAGCDALLARKRRGEAIPDSEVQRIANESECGAGWGWACGKAGWAFYEGEGAPKDPARALALFRTGCTTALTRDAWSCGMAGIVYVEGTGVSSDPTEGARWLSKGCETADPSRDDMQACDRLGLLAAEGRGVSKDVARARALFKKACDSSYQRACADLAAHPGS
jgi:ankyrin repeat protein